MASWNIRLCVKFAILGLVLALSFLPAHAQSRNWIGCIRNVACDVTPYVSNCCTESLIGEMDFKNAMVSCLKTAFFQELATCMNAPSTGDGGDMEQQRAAFRSKTYEMFRPGPKQERGFRSISRRSAIFSPSRSKYRRFGSPSDIQNEDCEYVKTNTPNGTEDCPSWSEAAGRCVNSIPMIAHFCQSSAFGGLGAGSFPTFGQGSFGGFGNPGFQFGQGSFGGMGSSGSSFGGHGSFGGMGGGGFGGLPSFGKRKTPNAKPYFPAPGDQREYEGGPP